jgi:hypothetical protein
VSPPGRFAPRRAGARRAPEPSVAATLERSDVALLHARGGPPLLAA